MTLAWLDGDLRPLADPLLAHVDAWLNSVRPIGLVRRKNSQVRVSSVTSPGGFTVVSVESRGKTKNCDVWLGVAGARELAALLVRAADEVEAVAKSRPPRPPPASSGEWSK